MLKNAQNILAPDLIWTEVASAVCKKVRRREISAEEGSALLVEFQNYPVQTTESKTLLDTAWRAAHDAGLSFYDALYLALSYDRDCSFVTADKKLYDRIHAAYPQTETVWLEDLKV